MKLSRKFVMVSAAALMAVAPVVPVITNGVFPVAAASKKSSKKPTITVKKNSYFYDKKGKRVKKFIGVTYLAKGQWAYVVSTKTVTIKGTKYYQLASNVFVKAVNVSKVNGKAVKSSTKKTTKKSTKKTTSKKTTKKSTKKTTSKKTAKKSTKKTTSKKTAKKSTKLSKTVVTTSKKVYVYDAKGKRVKNYEGLAYIGKNVKLKNLGVKTIKGVKYMALTPNKYYIKVSDVKNA